MDSLEKIIATNPIIQKIARYSLSKVPAPWRLGSHFFRWYAFFEASEQWSPEELQSYQLNRVRALLRNLKQTSHYYQERLGGIDLDRITSLESFSTQVPSIDRATYHDNFNTLLSKKWRRRFLSKVSTSGTTGMALQFYHERKDHAREWAAICHQWKRVGYDPIRSTRAEFRALTTGGKLVEAFPDHRMVRCSILHLKQEHVRHYADHLTRHPVDFFHGYPSALFLLAKEIVAHGMRFPSPKGILLASENVYDWQVAKIEEAFPRTKLFAHYGCAERTVLGGWCEHRREYHVLPQYSLVEIDPITREIIGTNLFNDTNAFIRYRMTDTVLEAAEEICPDCGRPYIPRLVTLGGRSEDYVYSPRFGWIAPAIITYPLKALRYVKEIQ
jgi:phenylacetate-coenzyme A ligase PaaK-like adenylate-forming protein